MAAERVLITGIAGLLGSHFSRYLLNCGYDVIGIDNFSGGYVENLPEGVFCSTINLEDIDSVNNFFKEYKPEIVYHFAAYAAEGLSPFVRTFNYQSNVITSSNLITASINHGVEKFIFTSSNGVYGDENQSPYTEDMVPKPVDPYAIAKYAIELDLANAYKQFGLNYSIVRPHNVIGIYQNIWDKYRNVIGIWIRQVINGETITVYGDGLQKRAFSDMKYCCEPFEKLAKDFNAEVFNIGSDDSISLIDAAKLVQKCGENFGYKSDIKNLEPRCETKFAYADHTKAKNLLQFKDNTNLEYSINEMFEWALSQPQRDIKSMKYEITKNIYGYWK